MAAAYIGLNQNISAYCAGLEATARVRYRQKVELCDDFDPYCFKKADFSFDLDDFPAVEFQCCRPHSTHANK